MECKKNKLVEKALDKIKNDSKCKPRCCIIQSSTGPTGRKKGDKKTLIGLFVRKLVQH